MSSLSAPSQPRLHQLSRRSAGGQLRAACAASHGLRRGSCAAAMYLLDVRAERLRESVIRELTAAIEEVAFSSVQREQQRA